LLIIDYAIIIDIDMPLLTLIFDTYYYIDTLPLLLLIILITDAIDYYAIIIDILMPLLLILPLLLLLLADIDIIVLTLLIIDTLLRHY
jgi:hypothetical protein